MEKIAILVADEVEDLEYFVPLMRLQEEGATVLTAALELKALRGKNGVPIIPDTLVSALRAPELSGLVIPGGWAPDKPKACCGNGARANLYAAGAHRIICHGCLVAISAGIVKATSHARGHWRPYQCRRNLGDETARTATPFRRVADIPVFCRELRRSDAPA
jgi:protease I